MQPYAIFERQVSYIYIMSKAYFDKVGDQGYATKPIGSGPYRVAEWVKADRMVLEANPTYWGGVPLVKKAIFRPVPAEASRANALLTGEVGPGAGTAAVAIVDVPVLQHGAGRHGARLSRRLSWPEPQQAAVRQCHGPRGRRCRDRPQEHHRENCSAAWATRPA